jgi:phage terminase small subunit
MPRQLNARQERFILEYLKDQNASAAAIRAGYSEKTKGTHAVELMRNPLIQERISLGMTDLYAEMGVNVLNLMKMQTRLAFFDPIHLFDETGQPLPIHQLDPDIRKLLTVGYNSSAKGTSISVRMPNKQQALAALERRYAKFMELQIKMLERYAGEMMEEEEQEGVEALEHTSHAPEATDHEPTVLAAVQPQAVQQQAAQPEPAPPMPVEEKKYPDLKNDPFWMFGGEKYYRPEDAVNPNPLFRRGAKEKPDPVVPQAVVAKSRLAELMPAFLRREKTTA